MGQATLRIIGGLLLGTLCAGLLRALIGEAGVPWGIGAGLEYVLPKLGEWAFTYFRMAWPGALAAALFVELIGLRQWWVQALLGVIVAGLALFAHQLGGLFAVDNFRSLAGVHELLTIGLAAGTGYWLGGGRWAGVSPRADVRPGLSAIGAAALARRGPRCWPCLLTGVAAGLIPLMLLGSWIIGTDRGPERIVQKTEAMGNAALQQAGFAWAKFRIADHIGHIEGAAPSETMRDSAYKAVETAVGPAVGLPGVVFTLENNMTTPEGIAARPQPRAPEPPPILPPGALPPTMTPALIVENLRTMAQGESKQRVEGAIRRALAANAEVRAAAQKAVADRLASEKAASEKSVADKAASDQRAAEKAATEKAAADKAALEKAAAAKADAERVAAERRAALTAQQAEAKKASDAARVAADAKAKADAEAKRVADAAAQKKAADDAAALKVQTEARQLAAARAKADAELKAKADAQTLAEAKRIQDAAAADLRARDAALPKAPPLAGAGPAVGSPPAISTPQPAPAAGCAVDLARALDNERLTFGSGAAALDDESGPRLDRVARAIQACPQARIVVAGHTDARGLARVNRTLSQRRADVVRAALIARGVPAEAVTGRGYGAQKIRAVGRTPEADAQNRRIEFDVVVPGVPAGPSRRLTADPGVCRQDLADLMTVGSLTFASGGARLSADSGPLLMRIADIALRCPSLTLAIAGHTDRTGDAVRNFALSRRRAEAVRTALIARGVPRTQILAQGFGSDRLLDAGTSAEAHARNRRIDITPAP